MPCWGALAALTTFARGQTGLDVTEGVNTSELPMAH